MFNLEGVCAKTDIVVIHDGIRPLVDAEVIFVVFFFVLLHLYHIMSKFL